MLKKVFSILFGCVVLFSVFACSNEMSEHEKNIQGFVSAITAFHGDAPSEQHIVISLTFGNGEVILNYDLVLDTLYTMLHDASQVIEPNWFDSFFEIQIRTRMDGDANFVVAVDVPRNNNEWINLFYFYIFDENVYLNLRGIRNFYENIWNVSPVLETAQLVNIAGALPADYIYAALNNVYLSLFFPTLVELSSMPHDINDAQLFISQLFGVFTNVFVENTNDIIFEDFNILSYANKRYQIAFDQLYARKMLENVFNAYDNLLTSYIDVFNTLFGFVLSEHDVYEFIAEMVVDNFSMVENHHFNATIYAHTNDDAQSRDLGLSFSFYMNMSRSVEPVPVNITFLSNTQAVDTTITPPQGRGMHVDVFYDQTGLNLENMTVGFAWRFQNSFHTFSRLYTGCNCWNLYCACGCEWGRIGRRMGIYSDDVLPHPISEDALVLADTVWANKRYFSQIFVYNSNGIFYGIIQRKWDAPNLYGRYNWDISGNILRYCLSGRTGSMSANISLRSFEIIDDMLLLVDPRYPDLLAIFIQMEAQYFSGSDNDVVPREISEDAQILANTFWSWVRNNRFEGLLIFYDDGIVKRGMYPFQRYNWNVDGDTLRIYATLMVELWTIEMVDDVLTLKSQQIPRWQYSYHFIEFSEVDFFITSLREIARMW